MTSKLLQGLGVAFVLALVAGALGGFLVLKDRVRVVVAADEVASGPDPAALLRDDVQTLARDVAALQQALASNFEQLGNALEERAAGRHAEVLAARRDVATAQSGITALGLQVAALRSLVEKMPSELAAALPAGPAPATGQAEAAPAAASPPPVAPAAEVVAPAASPVEPAVPAPAPPAAKTGFLSFSVPTAAFRFDAPQDYTLLPELCRVGFDAKSTLHDFTGVTSQVRGRFHADFDDPQGAWTGEVVVQAATLVTGVDGRDENLREHLATKEHAEIRFVVERFQPAADGVDVARQTARGTVSGTMTIRGQSHPFAMPVTVEVDAQKRVVLAGQAPLELSDYGVPVPSQLGLINMQDEVVVWIALRARAAGGRK